METSPLKNENDIAFMLDKKRKMETGFKIPKKKRLDDVSFVTSEF